MVSRRGQCDASAVSAGTADAAGAWATGPACCGAASRRGSDVQAATTANVRIDVRMSRVLLPNGSRLSCGRSARWRKAVERQIKRLAGEATQFYPLMSARQLQALVRQHAAFRGYRT